MYLSHFQLNLEPFQFNLDRRFLYLSEKHEKALAKLRYGILDNRGVLVLTGDVGTGKTLLIHELVETLGPDVHTAMITDPRLKGVDFFNAMSHAFDMGAESKTKGDFLFDFSHFLDGLFKAHQQALLIVDDAQHIDPVQLEEIRNLSNLGRGDSVLNIFFVGQNQFGFMIANKRLRALKQRITTNYHIAPLTLNETGHYVQYRLKVAGCDRPLFTASALEKIFGLTNGYPRLINILSDNCLLTAFEKQLHQIDSSIVHDCAADLMHASPLDEETLSPLEKRPGQGISPQADRQPIAASKKPPGVTTRTTQQVEPPESPKSFVSLLQAFVHKPAYLLAAVVLIAALMWLNFRDDPYHTVPPDQSAPPTVVPPTVRPEDLADQGKITSPATASTPVEAAGTIKPDQAPQADRVDAPSPSASPIDASTVVVDEHPQGLAAIPPPATTLTEPTADELEPRETERDPRDIIDFVIRKRSRQPRDQ